MSTDTTGIRTFRAERTHDRKISARDYLRSLFRYKWTMVAAFLVIFGSMTALTFILPEIYESQAKVLVKLGRESLFGSDPAASLAGSGGSGGASTNIGFQVNSQIEMLNNSYLAERVVERLGPEAILGKHAIEPDPDPENKSNPADAAVRAFMANLEVTSRVDSSVINLAYRAKDPARAQLVLATLLEEYVSHNVRVNATKASPDFFQGHVAEAQARLEARESELKDFLRLHGLTGDPVVQQNGHESAIAQLKAAIAEARGEASSAQARVRTLGDALEGRSRMTLLAETHGEQNSTADSLKDQRIELLRKLAELEALHPSTHRLVLSAREELRLVEDALNREQASRSVTTTGIDQTYETLKREYDMARADLESSQAKTELLQNELKERQAGLTELIVQTATMTQLQREVELLRKEYMDYRENLHLTQVNEALDQNGISNLSIAQPASLPIEPVSPNKVLNLAAGLLLGLLAAFALGFTLYLLDDTISTREQVEEHLDIPVLASITNGDYKQCI